MRTIMALTGSTLFGLIAWKVGGHVGGMPLAILLSTPASIWGFYYGRKLFDDNLGD